MRIGRTIKMGVAATTAVAVIAVPTAFAQSSDEPAEGSAITTDVEVLEGDFDIFVDPQEEIEYFNQLADDLAAHLEENGVDHTIQTGQVRWVQWDLADDEATGVVEDFLADNAEFEFFDIEDLSEAEVAEIQSEADAIRQALDDAGIAYTLETDPLGIEWPVFDEENDAAWEAVDQAFDELFADELGELSDEEIAEFRAEVQVEADAIRHALDDAGVTYTLETDPLGVEWPVYDYEDEAANEAVDQVFEQQWADELASLSDAEHAEIMAEMTEEADALRSALDEAGVSYTLETDPLGVEWPVFDEDDEAAWEVIDQVFEDMMDVEFGEGDFFGDDIVFEIGPGAGVVSTVSVATDA